MVLDEISSQVTVHVMSVIHSRHHMGVAKKTGFWGGSGEMWTMDASKISSEFLKDLLHILLLIYNGEMQIHGILNKISKHHTYVGFW